VAPSGSAHQRSGASELPSSPPCLSRPAISSSIQSPPSVEATEPMCASGTGVRQVTQTIGKRFPGGRFSGFGGQLAPERTFLNLFISAVITAEEGWPVTGQQWLSSTTGNSTRGRPSGWSARLFRHGQRASGIPYWACLQGRPHDKNADSSTSKSARPPAQPTCILPRRVISTRYRARHTQLRPEVTGTPK